MAQPLTPAAQEQCAGVELFFTAAGGDVIVTLGTVDDAGMPAEPLAQTRVPRASINTAGAATRVLWDPVMLLAGTTYLVSVACAEADTALQVAQVGEANLAGGWVTAASAAVGTVLQINASGIVKRHANRMLRFALLTVRYTAAEKTIVLGEQPVENATALMLLAGAEQPAADARITYALELIDGSGAVRQSIDLDDKQSVTLDAPHTGSVRAKATLRAGAGGLGAKLQPGTQLAVGSLLNEGTYITPAIATAGGADLRVIFEADIPAGAAVAVHAQLGADPAWVPVPYASSSPQTVGTLEVTHQLTGIAAPSLRLRLTLTGTTKARPKVRNLRAAVL